MFDVKEIKSIIINRGADLCGIAPVERFDKAPKGFHPKDIYERCKSVIVFANSIPLEPLNSNSCIPYTFVNKMITEKVINLLLIYAYILKNPELMLFRFHQMIPMNIG